MEIKAINDIRNLIRSGEDDWGKYGRVNVHRHKDLLLFNYKKACSYNGGWNWFELNSRGLLFNTKGRCLARPYEKFFNHFDVPPVHKVAEPRIVSMSEKQDGVLGILYFHNGDWKITTRGRLDSRIGKVATEMLHAHARQINKPINVPKSQTLMFEIKHPDHPIVLDIKEPMLVLTGGRNIPNGSYLPYNELAYLARKNGFFMTDYRMVKPHESDRVRENILRHLSTLKGAEGWVCRMSDGTFRKYKTQWYFDMSSIMQSGKSKKMIKWMKNSEVSDKLAGVTYPLKVFIRDEHNRLLEIYERHKNALVNVFEGIDASIDDKMFAHEIQSMPKKSKQVLWKMRRGQKISDLIWDMVSEDEKQRNRR